MDEKLRHLIRRARQGDYHSQEILDRMPICQTHEIIASDPAGWGSPRACPYCELDLWCGSTCSKVSCHKCFPQFDCEYGHESCYQMEDEIRQSIESETVDYEDEEEDDGRYDCTSCRGTGIGMRPDSQCGWCGGSGIERGSGYYGY